MTYSRREEIFSKDYISIADVQELLGMGYQQAARTIRDIKRALKISPKFNGQGVRLNVQGRLHVQDYLDYYNLPSDRYVSQEERRNKEVI